MGLYLCIPIYYRYNFTTNTANLRNFSTVSKLQIESFSHEIFTVALTKQGENIIWITKKYFTRKVPEFQSENPDYCKSLKKHIVYAGKHIPKLRFWWKLKTSGFSPNMRINCIGLSLGPFGTSGSQQPRCACQRTDIRSVLRLNRLWN